MLGPYPNLLSANSWPYAKGSLLAKLRGHIGCQRSNSTWLACVKGKHPTHSSISLALRNQETYLKLPS